MATKSDQLKLAALAREGFQPLEELSRGVTLVGPPSPPKPANVRIDHRSRWFWFPDTKLGFVLGFEAPGTYGKPVARITVPSSKTSHDINRDELGPAVTPLSVHLKADFTHLDDVNVATLLYNLSSRFKQGRFFSRIGPHIVFVNPHAPLPDHSWSTAAVQHYANNASLADIEPHVFELAQRSFQSLVTTNRDQHIFLQGVAGSGKTELCKKVLQYFGATNSGRNAGIAAKVAHANLLLRIFACARVGQSAGASRAVQHFECTFDINGSFDGVHFRSNYLETSRIVGRARTGLNFNAFYCLLGGSTASQQQFGLLQFPDKVEKRWENFRYLKPYGASGTEKENKAYFYQTLDAMAALGFTPEEVSTVWGVVAAVLALGNLEFDFRTLVEAETGVEAEAAPSVATPVPAATDASWGADTPPPGLLSATGDGSAGGGGGDAEENDSAPAAGSEAAGDALQADGVTSAGPPPGLLAAPPGETGGSAASPSTTHPPPHAGDTAVDSFDGPPPGLLGSPAAQDTEPSTPGALIAEGRVVQAVADDGSKANSPESAATPPAGSGPAAYAQSAAPPPRRPVTPPVVRVLEMVQSVDVITVCETLGITAAELERHLVAHPVIGELDVHGAKRQRDQLAIHLFLGLNNFILRRLNAILLPGSRKAPPSGGAGGSPSLLPRRRRSHLATSSIAPLKNRRLGSIHILDIPGFEQLGGSTSAHSDGAEQLLINFWSEAQTAFFQRLRFDRAQAIYAEQDVQFDANDRSLFSSFTRNTKTMESLQGLPAGVLRLVMAFDDQGADFEEEPGPTLLALCTKVRGTHADDSRVAVEAARPGDGEVHSDGDGDAAGGGGGSGGARATELPLAFTVAHFAASVTYELDDFITATQDALPQDGYGEVPLLQLLQSSSRPLISADFSRANDQRKRSRLSHLLATTQDVFGSAGVADGDTHAIYCLDSNHGGYKGVLDAQFVLQQLRGGYADVVHFYQAAFVHQTAFVEFFYRYNCLVHTAALSAGGSSALGFRNAGKTEALRLVRALYQESPLLRSIVVGKTKLLHRHAVYCLLEKRRRKVVEMCILVIQKHIRGHAGRKLCNIRRKLHRRIAKAIETRDPFKLKRVLQDAANADVDTVIVSHARKKLVDLEEEQTIQQQVVSLQEMDPHEHLADFQAMIESCDRLKLQGPLISTVKQKYFWACERKKSEALLYEGLFELDKKKIYRAIRLAERSQIVGIWGDFIASIRPVITSKLKEIEKEESEYQVLERPLIEHTVRGTPGQLILDSVDQKKLRAALVHLKLQNMKSKQGRFFVHKLGDSVFELRHWLLQRDALMVGKILKRFDAFRDEGTIPSYVAHEVQLIREDFLNEQYSKDLQLALSNGRIALLDTEEASDWDAMTALNVGGIQTESLDNAIRFAKSLPANQRLPLLKSTLQSAETIFRIRRALKAAFLGERELATLITSGADDGALRDARHDLEHDINATANAWKDLQHALDSAANAKLDPELQGEVDIATRCNSLSRILSQLTDACAPAECLSMDIGSIDRSTEIEVAQLREAIATARRVAAEEGLVLSPEIDFLLANADMLLKVRTCARNDQWGQLNDVVDRYFEETQAALDGNALARAQPPQPPQLRLRHHTEEELLRLQEEYQYQLLHSRLTAALGNHQIVGNYRDLTLPSYPDAVDELNAAVQIGSISRRVLDMPVINANMHLAKYTRAARLLVQECVVQQLQRQPADADVSVSGAHHCVLSSTCPAFGTLQNLLREAQRGGHLSSELLLLLQNVEHKYIAHQLHQALEHVGVVMNAQTRSLEIVSDLAISHLDDVLKDVSNVDYPHPDADTVDLIANASAVLQIRKAVASICEQAPADTSTTLHPSCFAMDADWVTIQTHVEGHVATLSGIANDDFDNLEKVVLNRRWCCAALSTLLDPEWDTSMKSIFRARFLEDEAGATDDVGAGAAGASAGAGAGAAAATAAGWEGGGTDHNSPTAAKLAELFQSLQETVEAAADVRELHSFPELVLHLAVSLLKARRAVVQRSWKELEESLVAVRSGECANTPGYHYLFTEIELMQDLLQKKMVTSTLAQALTQGGARGAIGALDTAGIDNRQIDRALRYAASVPEKSATLRDMLRAAMLVRRLRAALCDRNWGLVNQTILQARTVMSTFAALQGAPTAGSPAGGGAAAFPAGHGRPADVDPDWIRVFRAEVAHAELQLAYTEAARDLRDEMGKRPAAGGNGVQPLLEVIQRLERLLEGSQTETGLVRAGREELVRRLVNERHLSEEAQESLLRVDADKLDQAVLQLFKREDERAEAAKVSVTASTIQAYGAALCQRAVKYCNLNDVKAALKFCRYHLEFQYAEMPALLELASMERPQLLQRQLLAARENGDQRAVAKALRALKDLYFERMGHGSFAILDFPKLKTPLQFMHDHMLGLGGGGSGSHGNGAGAGGVRARAGSARGMNGWDTVQAHFMSHTRTMIATSLSVLPAAVPVSAALTCFKVVLAVTAEPINTSQSQAARPRMAAMIADLTRLINTVIRHADLRDEVYLQVIKQLNDNPRQDLTRQAWRMLDLLLEFVPPSTDFENFLESFVRCMGADDRRLFRLYTILSRPGCGDDQKQAGGDAATRLQFISEQQVSGAFHSIFKL